MKLDSEPIYSHSTLASKPDTKFFHYNDNTVETAWKVDNDTMGGDNMKVVSDRVIKECDTNTDSFPTPEKFVEAKNVPKLHDLVAVENLINGGGKETDDSFSTNGLKLSEKEAEFYTDKGVTELELPELDVCFNDFEDGDYRIVKDICIDDGHPSLTKVLVEDDEISSKGVFSSECLDLEVNDDLTKGTMNAGFVSNGTNPFIECDDNKADVANKHGLDLETLNLNGEEDIEGIADVESAATIFNVTNPFADCDISTDFARSFDFETSTENGDSTFNEVDSARISTGTNPFLECDSEDVAHESGFGNDEDVVSVEKTTPETLLSFQDLDSFNEDDFGEIANRVSVEKSTPETLPLVQELEVFNSPEQSNIATTEDQKQCSQDTSETAHSGESNSCNQAKEVQSNSEIKNGSTINDSDSSSPATSAKEREPENTNSQKTSEASGVPSIEEETADIRTISGRSFFIQNGFGETSFSAAGPLSGSLNFSGPIPYSGSISLRSDSSTTSTRSFAFPVLQSEWQSSPVKMAKADRRFWKRPGWGMSLLCCRF